MADSTQESSIIADSINDSDISTYPLENVLTGDGTAQNPYIISTAQDFLCASAMVSESNAQYASAVYSIQACIDFAQVEFVPIGTEEAPFKGTLLGNGHLLKNIALTDTKHFGVVGYMTQGNISNVNARYVSGKYSFENLSCFGGIIGQISTAISGYSVSAVQCSAYGNIEIDSQKALNCGGFIGKVYAKSAGVYVRDCIADVNLSASSLSNSYAGGFAAHLSTDPAGTYVFQRCVAKGNVDLETSSFNAYSGGFVASANKDEDGWSEWFDENATNEYNFSECIAMGNVFADSKVGGQAGGFLYYLQGFATVGKVLVSSEQTVTAKEIKKNIGTSCSVDNLKNSSYLSNELKFDFEEVWAMSEDGEISLKSTCGTCKFYPVVKVSQGMLHVLNVDADYAVMVSSYASKILQDVKIIPVSKDLSVSYEEIYLDVDTADSVKAFLFDSKVLLKPVCESSQENI
ncbi:MAG: hypothetical protein J6K12_05130 [Clostridia bacterium]|nr:hypothetical protein [Clostridia bacterium]